jgi:hypothetical protein
MSLQSTREAGEDLMCLTEAKCMQLVLVKRLNVTNHLEDGQIRLK